MSCGFSIPLAHKWRPRSTQKGADWSSPIRTTVSAGFDNPHLRVLVRQTRGWPFAWRWAREVEGPACCWHHETKPTRTKSHQCLLPPSFWLHRETLKHRIIGRSIVVVVLLTSIRPLAVVSSIFYFCSRNGLGRFINNIVIVRCGTVGSIIIGVGVAVLWRLRTGTISFWLW
jgi:hypothetical protein